MAVASSSLSILLVTTVTFVLVFPICQIASAQESLAPLQFTSISAIITGIVSGGIIGAAATLIGTYLNNRHNMNIKKQELKHDLSIELLKHRIECYSQVINYTEPVVYFTSETTHDESSKVRDNLRKWSNQEKGALLMSKNSHGVFTDLSLALTTFELKIISDEPLTEQDIEKVREADREFTISLIRDIGILEA